MKSRTTYKKESGISSDTSLFFPVDDTIFITTGLRFTGTLVATVYTYAHVRGYGRIKTLDTQAISGTNDYSILDSATSVAGYDAIEYYVDVTSGNSDLEIFQHNATSYGS